MSDNILDNAKAQEAGLPKIPDSFDDAIKLFGGIFKKYAQELVWQGRNNYDYVKRYASRHGVDHHSVWSMIVENMERANSLRRLSDWISEKILLKFGMTPEEYIHKNFGMMIPSDFRASRKFNAKIADEKNPGDGLSYGDTAYDLDKVDHYMGGADIHRDRYNKYLDILPAHYSFSKEMGEIPEDMSLDDFIESRTAEYKADYDDVMQKLTRLYDVMGMDFNQSDRDKIFGNIQLDPLIGIPIGKPLPKMLIPWYRDMQMGE